MAFLLADKFFYNRNIFFILYSFECAIDIYLQERYAKNLIIL